MASQNSARIEIPTDEMIEILRTKGLNACFVGKLDDGKHWTVAGQKGHEEGYGTFFQKGIIGWGRSLFEAWIDYERKLSAQKLKDGSNE